jgi:hypothetical protein
MRVGEMKIYVSKKFVQGQPYVHLDPQVEITALTHLLRRLELREQYEAAAIVYERLQAVRHELIKLLA